MSISLIFARDHIAAAALFAGFLSLAGLTPSAADEAQPMDEKTRKVVDSIARLSQEKRESVFDSLGIVPSQDFRNCLCPPRFWYAPHPLGPCEGRTAAYSTEVHAPLSSDPERWRYCSQAHPSPTGNAVLDQILAGIGGHSTAQEEKYKKLCDAAFLAFPQAAEKVTAEGTKMYWDGEMIGKSFDDAVERYRKDHPSGQPDNEIGLETGMGPAERYGLWLFGHGQDQLGGPLASKPAAAAMVRLDEVNTIIKEKEFMLQRAKESYHKKFEYDSPTNDQREAYFRQVETIQNELSKLIIEKRQLDGRREASAAGTEPALLSAIIKLKEGKKEERLTPGDVLFLALKQTGGRVNKALLLAHNTMRALARPGQGDFEDTGVRGDPEFFDETFVKLREGDSSGPFYHIFGTAFFAYQQRNSNLLLPEFIGSELANQAEQWFREYGGDNPQAPDPVKYCFNYWGARIGSLLYTASAPPPPVRH